MNLLMTFEKFDLCSYIYPKTFDKLWYEGVILISKQNGTSDNYILSTLTGFLELRK